MVGEDIVYFTVGYDANMAFLDNLDRDELELWLDNQNPRDNWEEYKRGGFLLLEETLTENWGGWVHEAVYQAYKFGMDILGVLGFNFVGLGYDIYELTDDSTEVEALLIENYALYVASLSEDFEIAKEEEAASRTLYKAYLLLHDNWGNGWDLIKESINAGNETIYSFRTIKELMDNEKMSFGQFLGLHSDVKYALKTEINKLSTFQIAFDNAYGRGSYEKFEEICEVFESKKSEFGTFSNKMSRVKTVADVFGVAMNLGTFGERVYSDLKARNIAIEKYLAYFQIIAQNTEDFNAVLDSYISASDDSKYKNALKQFKNDLNQIITEELIERLTNNETADSTADVCEAAWDVFIDGVKIICEQKNFRPAWLSKWPTSSKGTNLAVLGAQIVGSVGGSIVKIEEKEAVLKDMLYYEELKTTLGTAILSKFDMYRTTDHTPEQAAEIVSSLRYMKQLKYSGEYKALELCAMITDVIKYEQSVGTKWYLLAGKNGTWMVSKSLVDARSTSVQSLAKQLEASGYTVMCTKQPIQTDNVVFYEYDASTGSMNSISISNVLSPFNQLLPSATGLYFGFTPFVSSSKALSVTEAATLTQKAVDEEIREIQLRMDEDANDPENYAWWVKYVEDNTSSRIESLDIP